MSASLECGGKYKGHKWVLLAFGAGFVTGPRPLVRSRHGERFKSAKFHIWSVDLALSRVQRCWRDSNG